MAISVGKWGVWTMERTQKIYELKKNSVLDLQLLSHVKLKIYTTFFPHKFCAIAALS